MAEYRIVNYDVVNGEVNAAYETSFYVDLPDDWDTKELKSKLYKAGFVNRGIFNANFTAEFGGNTIYCQTTTKKRGTVPFCELRPVWFREKSC